LINPAFLNNSSEPAKGKSKNNSGRKAPNKYDVSNKLYKSRYV
jgi:hypothetical protein